MPDRDHGGTPGWRERLDAEFGADTIVGALDTLVTRTSRYGPNETFVNVAYLRALRDIAALAATAKREVPMPGEVRERVDIQAWNAFHAAAGGARITAAIHAGADEAWRAALAASSPQEDETATETGEWEVALICCGRDNGTQETGRRRVGSWRSPCHTGPKPDDAGLTPNEAVVLIYGTDGDPFERYAADALAALAPLLGSPGADEGQQR